MLNRSLGLLLFVLALCAAPLPARAQDKPAAAPAEALTPAQAQRALEVLQDDAKRAQFVDTLQAIAKAPPAGTATPGTPVPPDNLGAQLLVQASDWLGNISTQLASAARAISDVPMVGRWLVQMAMDPLARNTLFATAWKLALVILCALAAEWLVRRVVSRPLAAVGRFTPARSRNEETEVRDDIVAGDAAAVSEVQHRLHVLRYAWHLLLRLPFVIMRLFLELLPVASFAAVGNLVLATQLGDEATPRVVTLAIVNAYVLCRGIMCIARAIVAPSASQPSLLVIGDQSAAYIDIWTRRIAIVAVFGLASAHVAFLLGLYYSAYMALIKLVMLTVHLLVIIMILQCRQIVADLIRAPATERGVLAIVRNRLAQIWHLVAIALNLALWAVWALQVQNGYALVLQYLLATVIVLVVARVASMAAVGGLDRLFRIAPEMLARFPGLEQRANRYLPALQNIASGIIAVIAVIALLEVWGIDALAWFATNRVGGRLLSAVTTIAIAVAVAFAVWELSNVLIERHLTRLREEGHYARTARLRTFLPMLRTALLTVILTVVLLTTLSELGVNIAPLLAGAGIVGIAIGFGSQKLVQDLITGLFLLLENAVQVGDFVTVSGLTGTVENLSIRTIRLRASDGSVHIIPFSSVTSVTNTNRGIGNASISVNVAFKEDPDRVGETLKEIAAEMRKDPAFSARIRGDLDLWGVDKVDAVMTTIVGKIECTDSGRWPVQREFYRRMKQRFHELGIEIALPAQTTVVLHQPAPKPVEAEPNARIAAAR